jgi:hypothetical protein
MADRFYQIKDDLGSGIDLDTVVAINNIEVLHDTFRVGFIVTKGSYNDFGEFKSKDRSEIEREFQRFITAWKEYLNDKGYWLGG